MHRPNPVQSIPLQSQQFAQQSRQPITIGGSQPQPQQTPEMAIQQQMGELSLEIYARLATKYLLDDRYTETVSKEGLRQLATDSQTAAKAYFEAIGVQFNE